MIPKRLRPRTPPTRPRPAAVLGAPRARGTCWTFSIYVTDHTPRSRNALQNLTDLCEAHFPGRFAIEVVDVLQAPERARVDDIVAVPTIVRRTPGPTRRVIGDLTDQARASAGLQLSA